MFIEPKTITLTSEGGVEKQYVISKFPAVQGREIIVSFPLSAIPKIGDYQTNEKIMLKMMLYVAAIKANGEQQILNSMDLVNNHVPDFQTLIKLEAALLDYNVNFSKLAKSLGSFGDLIAKLPPSISKILMDLSEQSSPKAGRRSKS